MKTFKVGDRVVHNDRVRLKKNYSPIGEVVSINYELGFVMVKWFSGTHPEYPNDLEHAENPIQRMKRRYSET